MTRQERKDQHRNAHYTTRYDRETLAAACNQCSVKYGPVECERDIADGYLEARKQENSTEITKTVPVQWVMASSSDPLLYVGA